MSSALSSSKAFRRFASTASFPPNLAFQAWNVASGMLCLRRSSAVFAPASCFREMQMICSSMYFNRFLVLTCHGIFLQMRLESGPTSGRTLKRRRFTDDQIIGILAEHEAGANCADLCRKHGMSEGAFYNWKAKFGGMTVSEVKRLKTLEDKNARPKKLLAKQMLDMAAMKDLLSKKW